jgi:hypothetical protein
MEIRKATSIETGGADDGARSRKLTALVRRSTSRRRRSYLFSVRLVRQQIDRDYERFDDAALAAHAEIFVGEERHLRP